MKLLVKIKGTEDVCRTNVPVVPASCGALLLALSDWPVVGKDLHKQRVQVQVFEDIALLLVRFCLFDVVMTAFLSGFLLGD